MDRHRWMVATALIGTFVLGVALSPLIWRPAFGGQQGQPPHEQSPAQSVPYPLEWGTVVGSGGVDLRRAWIVFQDTEGNIRVWVPYRGQHLLLYPLKR